MQINTQKQYNYYVVNEPAELLNWLITHLADSPWKIMATLPGQGIKVEG